MNDDPDPQGLAGLADIGDPFAEDASAPVRSMDAARIPERVGSSPTRARVHRVRRIAFVAALVYDFAYLGIEHRPDLGTAPTGALLLGLAIPLMAAGVAWAAATRRGPRGLGLPAGWLAALAILAPAFFAVATIVVSPSGLGDPLFWKRAAGCGAVTSFLAVGPLGFGLWAFRHAFVAAARWRSAAVGIAAGALAAGTMSLVCPITGAVHLLLGHGAVMLVAGLAGAWLAPALARS